MVANIIDLFQLPKSSIVDRKLDKKKIYEQADTTPALRAQPKNKLGDFSQL